MLLSFITIDIRPTRHTDLCLWFIWLTGIYCTLLPSLLAIDVQFNLTIILHTVIVTRLVVRTTLVEDGVLVMLYDKDGTEMERGRQCTGHFVHGCFYMERGSKLIF